MDKEEIRELIERLEYVVKEIGLNKHMGMAKLLSTISTLKAMENKEWALKKKERKK